MPSTPPPIPTQGPLDYAHHPMTPAPSYYATELLAILLPFGVIATAVLLFAIPNFELIFKDFGTELPASTKVLLQISRSFRDIYGAILFWILLLSIPAMAAPLIPHRRRARWMIWAVIVTVISIAGAFVVIALFAPMVALVRAVSGK